MKDERTRASRRRFKEGQLRPVLRPILGAGCSFFLLAVGLVAVAFSGLGRPDDTVAHTGWALIGVGVVLFLWGVFSRSAKRRKSDR
jgi:hypothetical protein